MQLTIGYRTLKPDHKEAFRSFVYGLDVFMRLFDGSDSLDSRSVTLTEVFFLEEDNLVTKCLSTATFLQTLITIFATAGNKIWPSTRLLFPSVCKK